MINNKLPRFFASCLRVSALASARLSGLLHFVRKDGHDRRAERRSSSRAERGDPETDN